MSVNQSTYFPHSKAPLVEDWKKKKERQATLKTTI